MKVMTIIGTRPEIIKMSRVISALDKSVNHILVHSGQNHDYELNQVFFDELNIRKPNFFLEVAGGTTMEMVARILTRTDELLLQEKPDAVVIYGDTNTGLAAIAAKKRKIPIFHLEAGNRCYDQNVPEELNRKIIDHLSDINMVLTEHARRNLLAEGLRQDAIVKTGSHMREVFIHHMSSITSSKVIAKEGVVPNRYFLVSAHREENVDNPDVLREILAALNKLATKYKFPILMSNHPRTKKRIELLIGHKRHPLIKFSKPYGFFDYVNLQMNAACVITDSGSITEEASLLNFPAISIRRAHERPEGVDSGTILLAGTDAKDILTGVHAAMKLHQGERALSNAVDDYSNDSVSTSIVKAIIGYTGYVNRNTWKK
jgi:UDP-N-acetylglucosamine 2-epimerase (non-hydrolysing)